MRVPRFPNAALCAIWLLLAALLIVVPAVPAEDIPRDPEPETEVVSTIPPAFRLVGLDDRPNLRNSVRLAAMRARYQIMSQTSLDWEGTALIVWTDERTFLEETGFRPENTAAAASASRMTIWINEPAWIKATAVEQQRTMTHECGHLLLGSLPGGRNLPLWANEGIVMHLAGQWSWDEHLALLAAHAAGALPPLRSLEMEFPRDGQSQLLAYRMSYAAIGVVAQSYGDDPGEVRRIVSRLASPDYGPRFAEEFWDDFRREGWQRATERSLGSRFATAFAVMTGTTSIFVIITLLAFVAWWRKRGRLAERRRQWEEEDEPWTESLTDEDVQDIYGDREERWQEDSEREERL